MCWGIPAFLGWSSFDSQCLEIIRGRDPGVATATANQRAKKNFPFISRADFSLSHLEILSLGLSLFKFLYLSRSLSHSSPAEQIMYAATRQNTRKGIRGSVKCPFFAAFTTPASLTPTQPYCNREKANSLSLLSDIFALFTVYVFRDLQYILLDFFTSRTQVQVSKSSRSWLIHRKSNPSKFR